MQTIFGCRQSQQKPALFLADTLRAGCFAAHTVAAAGSAASAGSRRPVPHRIVSSPISSLSSRYSACSGASLRKTPALRELPAATAGAPAQKYLAIIADQYDPDIGPKTFGVDEIGHGAIVP